MAKKHTRKASKKISRTRAIRYVRSTRPVLHQHWPVNVGIILAVLGIAVFFYGLILSDTALYSFVLSLNGSEASSLHGAAPEVSTTAHAVFLLATLLVTPGAGCDVWRRLHPRFE